MSLHTERFELRISKHLKSKIDSWRKKQPEEIPSRAEAIRSLIETGLKAHKG